jgi:hypothetical protein
MRNIIILIVALLFLSLSACGKVERKEILIKPESNDTVKKLNTSPMDSLKTKQPDEVYISLIERTVRIADLQDDISDDFTEYQGMYTADLEDIIDSDDAVWEDLIIDVKGKEIIAHIDYYVKGKKTDEFNLVNINFNKNILSANIIRNGKEEIFTGRFVSYPYETEETDFVYGFLAERYGKFVLFEAEY